MNGCHDTGRSSADYGNIEHSVISFLRVIVCRSFAKATGYNDDGNRVCDFYLRIELFYFRQIIDCYDNRDVSMKRPNET